MAADGGGRGMGVTEMEGREGIGATQSSRGIAPDSVEFSTGDISLTRPQGIFPSDHRVIPLPRVLAAPSEDQTSLLSSFGSLTSVVMPTTLPGGVAAGSQAHGRRLWSGGCGLRLAGVGRGAGVGCWAGARGHLQPVAGGWRVGGQQRGGKARGARGHPPPDRLLLQPR